MGMAVKRLEHKDKLPIAKGNHPLPALIPKPMSA
jgi:hypothetical protein